MHQAARERPATIAIAMVILVVVGVFAVRWWARSDTPTPTPTSATGPMADRSADDGQVASVLSVGSSDRRPLSGLVRRLRRSGQSSPLYADGGAGQGKEPRWLPAAALFDGNACNFGVHAHCKEWNTLGTKCDAGHAAACVQLGNLLITESPMQPLWGGFLLRNACLLGRQEQCERANKWIAWSKFGYAYTVDAEMLPEGIVDACMRGDHTACGLVQMARRRTDGMDATASLAACRAGFRDVCTMLMEETKSPAIAVAAAKAGCDLPDAYICLALARYYEPTCARDPDLVCPTPDPARAARYKQIACQLHPTMGACKTSPAR